MEKSKLVEKIVPLDDSQYWDDLRRLEGEVSPVMLKMVQDAEAFGFGLDVPPEVFAEFSKKAKQLLGKYTWKIAKIALPLYALYAGSVYYNQKPDGKFSEKDRARIELQTTGITSEQASVYKAGLSELLHRGVIPFGYQGVGEKSESMKGVVAVRDFIPNIVLGREKYHIMLDENKEPYSEESDLLFRRRDDAWRLYLGLPQERNTFGVSDYKPGQSTQDKFYLKINDFTDKLKKELSGMGKSQDSRMATALKSVIREEGEDLVKAAENLLKKSKTDQEKKFAESFADWVRRDQGKNPPGYERQLLRLVEEIKNKGGKIDDIEMEGFLGSSGVPGDLDNIMGNYSIFAGEDSLGRPFLAYVDKWDLDIAAEASGGVIGRSFEIYDRIYYNPETGEIIQSLLSK